MTNYIRFVVAERIEGLRHRLGVINVSLKLLEQDELVGTDRELVRAILDEYNETLPIPSEDLFNRSGNPDAVGTALSWFKPTAVGMIRSARGLVRVLEDNGVYTETLITDKPGYVLYEDEFQVVAVPFKNDIF